MAINSRSSTELLIPKKWSDQQRTEVSPERTKVWIEPRNKVNRKVPVIYYLSRNGNLEHPHFIEVPLSSSHGLYLKDVINRLNFLRGEGMAYMYSWSCKRSYKNGYVWQDLSDDDLVHPSNGRDYVLKGSELVRTSISETASSGTKNCEASSVISPRRRKNQSWSSFENAEDGSEYVIFKCESSREFAGKFSLAADAATQTEEKRWGSGNVREEVHGNKSVVLSREELSPPLITSGSEGSDGVSGSEDVHGLVDGRDRTADNDCDSIVKLKASKTLMQLITCGSSMGFKQYGPRKSKDSKVKAR